MYCVSDVNKLVKFWNTVDCIYPWTHTLKTCFHVTSNFWVSGVKLWSFPAQMWSSHGKVGRVGVLVVHSVLLGGKTSKFDAWNSEVWRHVKTCFERVRSRVDAIDGKSFCHCKSFFLFWIVIVADESNNSIACWDTRTTEKQKTLTSGKLSSSFPRKV